MPRNTRALVLAAAIGAYLATRALAALAIAAATADDEHPTPAEPVADPRDPSPAEPVDPLSLIYADLNAYQESPANAGRLDRLLGVLVARPGPLADAVVAEFGKVDT